MHVASLIPFLFYLARMPIAISALDHEHIAGSEVSLEMNTDQLSRRQQEDPLVLLRREDGGYDIFSSSQIAERGIDSGATAKQEGGQSLNKRASFPGQVCEQFGDRRAPCFYETESVKCIDSTTYQVYCAGCFNHNKARNSQKVGKQACPPRTRCLDTRHTNAWGEDAEYATCVPVTQSVDWPVETKHSQDTQGCSPGLTNRSGRDAKVEITVASQNKDHQYLVTPQRVSLVLNGKELEHADRDATLFTDLVLRSFSSVQGCLTTIGSENQVLGGRFGMTFV